jgi:hypothetical protein
VKRSRSRRERQDFVEPEPELQQDAAPTAPAINLMPNMERFLNKLYQFHTFSIHICNNLYHRKARVEEPHHFDAALSPGENFDAAPAPTLLYSKAKFLKRTKV